MRRVILVAVVGLLTCTAFALPVWPQGAPLDASATAARTYLEALKVSDLGAIRPAAAPNMIQWTEKYLKGVYDYKLLRGEAVCAETVRFVEVRAPVALYVANTQKFRELIDRGLSGGGMASSDELKALTEASQKARAAITPAYPCLSQMLNRGGQGLFSEPFLAATGELHDALNRFLVDLEKPGPRGSRVTERRDLAIARLAMDGNTTGWRIINFGVLSP